MQAVGATMSHTRQLKEFIPKYSEAEAIGSLYASCIFGIGVFTPELFSDNF